ATSSIPIDDYPPALPTMIRRQPAHIQQAYRDVEATIKLNKELAKETGKKELPDPYFLRARLWAFVKDYNKALQDYNKGASLVKDDRLDPVNYARYFDDLQKTLDKLDAAPRPIDPGSALYHFDQGRQAFWACDYEKAMRYFDDAVALDAAEPLYWYYRA